MHSDASFTLPSQAIGGAWIGRNENVVKRCRDWFLLLF